jgi:hypothetical protein
LKDRTFEVAFAFDDIYGFALPAFYAMRFPAQGGTLNLVRRQPVLFEGLTWTVSKSHRYL